MLIKGVLLKGIMSSTVVTSEYFSSGGKASNASAKKISRKRKIAAEENVSKTLECNTSSSEQQTTESVLCNRDTGLNAIYTFDFYNIPCVELAKKLLGKVLVRRLPDGTVCKGCIVETESYLGGEDKASQSYLGKKTERNIPMFMKPGTAYVYLTYGMYHCFNISSEGEGAAVLIRALDPLQGQDSMMIQRLSRRKPSAKNTSRILKPHELCNGPGKLTMSFDIDRATCNKIDLAEGGILCVESGEDVPNDRIVVTSRIGIDSAGVEWASKPLRFYVLGNPSVSRRDRKAEALMIKTNS